ncbi:AAA family ATPase [Devosia sp. FJ2-5-3]|uniref:AAA family ATPase n=1 Tax=Devosia sp. FJ2-5-3 TaxID=2976680 RepID=UPI0023D8B845|nr:AAA family ATPase [Devosia sp. FJ2-5-3]WEJ56759.1 AAA family ATPase [Devosia sp. FJ2-5-3]
MNDLAPIAGQDADLLARAYIDQLAKAEQVKTRSMLKSVVPVDPLSELLGGIDQVDDDGPHLRVDLVMAAVLLAKAVASEPGLAARLRREAPILTIETHTAEMVPLVATVFEDCATSGNRGSHVVSRDGSERGHTPERGNADVIASLNRRKLTAGVAPDVKRQLPISLQRTAEYKLSIPAIDGWSIGLVIEACAGAPIAGPIDPQVIRNADLGDLSLAIRVGLNPEECLRRLSKIIDEKASFAADGPELKDLHGYGDAMAWALDLVSDLGDYKRGEIEWDDVDNTGLLLAGAPGLGKTSFAVAIAKTAGVPLIATSVAEWNAASYLSGTLQAIRDVFGQARRSAPCIMLIDECDGISDRSTVSGEYTEYWLQIVNCLLECMSGVANNKGVVIIATSNHPEKIDAAVRRAGRLDRTITLEKPSAKDLAMIFRHHIGRDALQDVDLMPAALAATGQTGADVESYVKRAKAVARRARRPLGVSDILHQIRVGRRQMSVEARHRVAIHEAGHTIVGRVLETSRFLGVSIDDSGGVTEFADTLDLSISLDKVSDLICLMLAGRAAETLVLGDVAVGSGVGEGSDLFHATNLARMVEASGNGKLRNLYLPPDLSHNVLQLPGLMVAVKERLDDAEARAIEILRTRATLLEAIASRLEEAGCLSEADIDLIMSECDVTEAAQ